MKLRENQERASKDKINLFALTTWATLGPHGPISMACSSGLGSPVLWSTCSLSRAAQSRVPPDLVRHPAPTCKGCTCPPAADPGLPLAAGQGLMGGGSTGPCGPGLVGRQGGRQEGVVQCRELLFCSSKAILPRSWLSNSTPLTGSWKKFISAAKAAMAEGSWPN